MNVNLQERLVELADQERQAWAQVNFVLGAKAEVEYLLSLEEGSAPAEGDVDADSAP